MRGRSGGGLTRWGGSGGGGFRWGRGCLGAGEGVEWGEGSKGANVRVFEGEQKGKRYGGRELNGIFLQIEFRFRNGLGSTIALQSFRITHLINAEILPKLCTTREKIKWKKSYLM